MRHQAASWGLEERAREQYARYIVNKVHDELTAPSAPAAVLDRVFELTVRLAESMRQEG